MIGGYGSTQIMLYEIESYIRPGGLVGKTLGQRPGRGWKNCFGLISLFTFFRYKYSLRRITANP